MTTKMMLRLPLVLEQTGMSRSFIYANMKNGMFPKCINLSKRSVAWLQEDIAKWQEEKIAASRQEEA